MPIRFHSIYSIAILGAITLSSGCGSGRGPADRSVGQPSNISSRATQYSPQRFIVADGYSSEGPEAARLQAQENLARTIRSEIQATFINVATEVQGTGGDDEYRDEFFHRIETHTSFRHNQLIEVPQIRREGNSYVALAVASRERLDQELALDQRRSEGRTRTAVTRAESAADQKDLSGMARALRALEKNATEVLEARIQRRAIAHAPADLGYDPTPDLLRVVALGDQLRASAMVHLSTPAGPDGSPAAALQVQSAVRTCLQRLDIPATDAAAERPCLGIREPHQPHFALQVRPTVAAKWGLLGYTSRLELQGRIFRCGKTPPTAWVDLNSDEPIIGHHTNNEDAATRKMLAELRPEHLEGGLRRLLGGEIPLS